MLTFTKTAGFLYIGDPHVSSRRVGRRLDDYLQSVLDKLSACATLCAQHDLTAVVLGDLFHRNDDNNLVMLNRLTRVLKQFPTPPIVLEGNHDKEQTTLSDNDALMLLDQCGIVRVAMRAGLFDTFEVEGVRINLHMAPHGTVLPDSVPESNEVMNVLITHHDLAFGSAYPGSEPLKAIAGVAMAINGHMHDTKSMQLIGETHWHNPGNIEPLSIDLADHVPCAWMWNPKMGPATLKALPLPHGTDLFDRTGVQVEAGNAETAIAEVVKSSEFAALLSSDVAMDAQKTDDASVLQEDLERVLAASNASNATALLLRSLMGDLEEMLD